MGAEERLNEAAVNEHTLIAVEHRHRYEFARPLCTGKRVVDLCCGVGYGSEIVAATAASVTGVDLDHGAIQAARATVASRSGVEFLVADALGYLRALDPEAVDVVVCFEGLEHLENIEEVAAELVRLVTGGVGLIASVPNSATFDEVNEFHVTDFDLASAKALFSGLPGLQIAYQTHAEGSLIRGRAAGPATGAINVDDEQDLDWANHFLLIAGVDATDLLSCTHAALHLAVAPVSYRYMHHLEQANQSLWESNFRLLRGHLGTGAAGGASAAIRAEQTLQASRDEVSACRHYIARLESDVESQRAEVESLRAERDAYRRAHVAVHSSRLTNLAARIAGHRFQR